MKVGNGRMQAAYSYSRRRWSNMYVVMVIVCSVFGCGILGLMRAHRLRERRYFSLVIKEKDEQIISLHLLLQKERDSLLEAKRKTEEMKMEIRNLGSQKAELNGRIQDVEEKMMREKEQNPQVEALMEELRLKQGEIEDLKHPLQLHGAEVGETESSMTTSKEDIGKNSGTNADGRIEKVGAKESDDEERERRENDEGNYADREALARKESQSRENREVEMHGGGMKMERQENPHRVRGKRGYLRRTKGKRRRPIAKASTMVDQGDKLLNAESSGEGGEERPPGKVVVQSEDSEELSSNALSSEKTHVSVQESTEKPAVKIEDTGSANKDAVQHTEENEHLEEQSTVMKPSDDGSEQQHTDTLAQKEAIQRGETEESELGEEKEERDEHEF